MQKENIPAQNVPVQNPPETASGPRWSGTTKLVVSLALIAVLLLLLVEFRTYFGLILASFAVTILLWPIVKWINQRLKISWRLSTVIVYVVVAVVLIGFITWGGVALFAQLQNLITLLSSSLSNFIENLSQWSNQEIILGPLSFPVPELTTKYLGDLLISRVQPILESAGSLIALAVSGGANLIFRMLMMYLIAFFVTSESGSTNSKPSQIFKDYERDIQQMKAELSRIWSAFWRGELLVVFIAFVVYVIFLSILQMPFSLGIAIIVALGRFIPYLGAWIGWITMGIVGLIIRPTPFGLLPAAYTLIIIAIALVIDNIIDNIIRPKVMGDTLRVHPAAVLITALVGVQLFGLLGIMLAAPVFASAKLLFHYILSKLTDQDPWHGIDYQQPGKENLLTKWLRKVGRNISRWTKNAWRSIHSTLERWFSPINARIEKRKSDKNITDEK
jgi:predicted PurR-regulated permease PerM